MTDTPMRAKRPGFSKLSQLQERGLRDQLSIARELISHPAEKGRSLEREVAAVLRQILPSEYGVGTGFVVFHGLGGPELSSQLDIIIYDAVRGGPLGRLAGCEVYPIEVVYGYVEVKAAISLPRGRKKSPASNSIQRCMEQNHTVRQMKTRHFWDTSYGGSPIRTSLVSIQNWLSLRGFVFAFEADGSAAKDPDRFAQGMSDCARDYDAHLHGVLILDSVYLTTIPVDTKTADPRDYYHVSYTTEQPFTAFQLHLLKALGTFQRSPEYWTPAWETYFELPTKWKTVRPRDSIWVPDGDEQTRAQLSAGESHVVYRIRADLSICRHATSWGRSTQLLGSIADVYRYRGANPSLSSVH